MTAGRPMRSSSHLIGKEKIEKIMTNPTTHLMDPYRKWIKTDE